MIQVIKKSEQFNDVIFGGRFHANKPVYSGKSNVKPYSSLYYWSNGYVKENCEFGLHPHEGFEIMTFLFEGIIEHYDTATKVWTPLKAGDFQIIQSNSGIQHQEKVAKSSRAFQIWFDPNFTKSLSKSPAYKDYSTADWESLEENSFQVNYYIGGNSPAKSDTEGLIIKKFTGYGKGLQQLKLIKECNYHFYLLNGSVIINGKALAVDDVLKATNISDIEISLGINTELFLIQTPVNLSYHTVWE